MNAKSPLWNVLNDVNIWYFPIFLNVFFPYGPQFGPLRKITRGDGSGNLGSIVPTSNLQPTATSNMSAKYRATLLFFLAYCSLQGDAIPTISPMENISCETHPPTLTIDEMVRYSAPYVIERPKFAPAVGGGGGVPIQWAWQKCWRHKAKVKFWFL